MIRKIVLFISLLFCCTTAHAAEMVNVEYIHKLIARDWGIDIPYNPALTNPKVAANMKYLLATVDRANEILNEVPTTEYGDGEYATMYAADTVATNDAVARLIKKGKDYTFEVITTPDTDSFSFEMSAAGTFTVDWGDGEVQEIVRTDTESATYSHTYARARKYKIGFEGQATGYSTVGGWSNGAIAFASNQNVGAIRGSLGAIFSTIGDGSGAGQQPRFAYTFYRCSNMGGTIPENLFTGVHGQPADTMFLHLFDGCGNLTGSIPPDLFAGIKGTPTTALFSEIFYGCRSLTGSIPPGLFAGISGAPTTWLFNSTFRECSGLTGSIPDKLFAGIKGAPELGMFARTFSWCANLTGQIPENLFGDIAGSASPLMFYHMFEECRNLSGPSAKINGKYLYEIWPEPVPYSVTGEVGSSYRNATGLSDYAEIPSVWK